ncbi:MAG: hypothetical protein ABIF87_04390 [Pseudomonadota bacterium]
MSLISSFTKLSGWYRIGIVVSIIWIIVALIATDPWTHLGRRGGSYNNWDVFLLVGILPVVALWGFVWIRHGFNKDKIESNK